MFIASREAIINTTNYERPNRLRFTWFMDDILTLQRKALDNCGIIREDDRPWENDCSGKPNASRNLTSMQHWLAKGLLIGNRLRIRQKQCP